MDKPPITEQISWLTGAIERARQTAGPRSKCSYVVQDVVDRAIDQSPKLRRIQVFADRRDVLRFTRDDSGRLIYRGCEILPVKYKDPLRPWAGFVPSQ